LNAERGVACVASASEGLMSKERMERIFGFLPVRKLGQEPKKKKKQPLPPLFFFGSRLTFWFLGFSLLPNLTETLATQA